MADKMIRMAGRDPSGLAKPLKVDEQGNLKMQLQGRNVVENLTEYEPIAFPKHPLKWESMLKQPTIIPRGIGADGNLYGNTLSNIIWFSEDSGTTIQMGFDFSTQVPSSIIYVTKTDAGFVVITRDIPGGNSAIWFSTNFNSGFTKALTLTKGHVELFNIHFYHGQSRNDRIGLVSEYSQTKPSQPRGLYFTTDGGRNWKKILDSVATDTNANSHWHHATYDPTKGRIIAACGDGSANAALRYSDDRGATWKTIDTGGFNEYTQPTLIVPLFRRIILAPDSGSATAQVLSLENDNTFKTKNSEKYITKHLYSVSDGASAGEFYGSPPYAQRDEEVYLPYWDHDNRRIFIVASGDGGASWHRIYANHAGAGFQFGAIGIVGVDKNGYIFTYANDSGGAFLMRSKTIGWIYK